MSAAHKSERPLAGGRDAKQSTENRSHFTQVHRAWTAIFSVAQRHAFTVLMIASGAPLVLAATVRWVLP